MRRSLVPWDLWIVSWPWARCCWRTAEWSACPCSAAPCPSPRWAAGQEHCRKFRLWPAQQQFFINCVCGMEPTGWVLVLYHTVRWNYSKNDILKNYFSDLVVSYWFNGWSLDFYCLYSSDFVLREPPALLYTIFHLNKKFHLANIFSFAKTPNASCFCENIRQKQKFFMKTRKTANIFKLTCTWSRFTKFRKKLSWKQIFLRKKKICQNLTSSKKFHKNGTLFHMLLTSFFVICKEKSTIVNLCVKFSPTFRVFFVYFGRNFR